MDMFAVYAHAYYPESNAGADSPVPSKPNDGTRTTGFDWFFATGVLMALGLIVTFVSVVA